jgi:pSer/pThr/pTyr-binding forkhead associated (FHA) protein
MNVVLVRFKDGERREYPLAAEKTLLGRRPDCTLRIASSDVSRQHCELHLSDRGLRVKDLGSSNGTYVNGQRVSEAALKAGDRLMVGPVVFVVQIDGKPAKITPEQAKSERPAAAQAAADDADELELGAEDLDIDDVISSLDDLDEEKDMP